MLIQYGDTIISGCKFCNAAYLLLKRVGGLSQTHLRVYIRTDLIVSYCEKNT